MADAPPWMAGTLIGIFSQVLLSGMRYVSSVDQVYEYFSEPSSNPSLSVSGLQGLVPYEETSTLSFRPSESLSAENGSRSYTCVPTSAMVVLRAS